MRVRIAAAVAVVLALGVVAPAHADAELTLVDGRVLTGKNLERKDALYYLTGANGEVVTIPVEQVKTFRLFEDPDAAPSGLKLEPPRTLAGPSDEPAIAPSPAEALEAFGRPPAAFRRDLVRPSWQPTDAFAGKDVTNFNPARWIKAPFDATWTPKSAYTNRSDVTQFSPVRWATGPFDNRWTPKDAYGETIWFPGIH